MKINNLKGEYTDYVLQYDSLFTFNIYNQGWSTQDYNYYIINGQGDTLYYSSTIVAENSFVIKEIDIEFVTSLCPKILSLIYTTIRFSKKSLISVKSSYK